MQFIAPSEPGGQWTKREEELSMLKRENTCLVQEKANLIEDLEECKLELFKRMPPTQISDDSIRKEFGRIRGSIDEFVYDIMGDVADDALYDLCVRKHQKHKQKKRRRRSRDALGKFLAQETSVYGGLTIAPTSISCLSSFSGFSMSLSLAEAIQWGSPRSRSMF